MESNKIDATAPLKRTMLVVGLLMAFLTAAFVEENLARPKVALVFDESAQLGSAHPEITHWPELVVDEGAQLGSAYPEIRNWPEPVVDEGAQLGSAFPEITHWPEPVMQVGTHRHISPGE